MRREDFRIFLGKAADFLETMDLALAGQRWDSVGLQAVHSVISAGDALAAYFGGAVSAELDHRAAAALLEDLMGKNAAPTLRQMSRVISKKNVIEYEGRRLTEKEATDMAQSARRFFEWAVAALPPK